MIFPMNLVKFNLDSMCPFLRPGALKGLENETKSEYYQWEEPVTGQEVAPGIIMGAQTYERRTTKCIYLAAVFSSPQENDDRLPVAIVEEWASMLNAIDQEAGIVAALESGRVKRLMSGLGYKDLQPGHDYGPPTVAAFSFIHLRDPSIANLPPDQFNRHFGMYEMAWTPGGEFPGISLGRWRWQVHQRDPSIRWTP